MQPAVVNVRVAHRPLLLLLSRPATTAATARRFTRWNPLDKKLDEMYDDPSEVEGIYTMSIKNTLVHLIDLETVDLSIFLNLANVYEGSKPYRQWSALVLKKIKKLLEKNEMISYEDWAAFFFILFVTAAAAKSNENRKCALPRSDALLSIPHTRPTVQPSQSTGACTLHASRNIQHVLQLGMVTTHALLFICRREYLVVDFTVNAEANEEDNKLIDTIIRCFGFGEDVLHQQVSKLQKGQKKHKNQIGELFEKVNAQGEEIANTTEQMVILHVKTDKTNEVVTANKSAIARVDEETVRLDEKMRRMLMYLMLIVLAPLIAFKDLVLNKFAAQKDEIDATKDELAATKEEVASHKEETKQKTNFMARDAAKITGDLLAAHEEETKKKTNWIVSRSTREAAEIKHELAEAKDVIRTVADTNATKHEMLMERHNNHAAANLGRHHELKDDLLAETQLRKVGDVMLKNDLADQGERINELEATSSAGSSAAHAAAAPEVSTIDDLE